MSRHPGFRLAALKTAEALIGNPSLAKLTLPEEMHAAKPGDFEGVTVRHERFHRPGAPWIGGR